MQSDNASSTRTIDALALLELPALDGLSEVKVRGAACIWCSVILTAETAVNLGERRHKRLGGHFYTFPRSCRPCTRNAAGAALRVHAGCCEQCVDDPNICETAAALRQLREGVQ